jgi:hypothetical protein
MSYPNFGGIFVDEIIDNPDGTATVRMTIPDATRAEVMKHYGWTEWSHERFSEMVLKALRKAAKDKEDENAAR